MGGGTPAEVTQEPTLSEEQLRMLDNLIRAVTGQISGFPMGAPYGGPGMASYETRPFDIHAGQIPKGLDEPRSIQDITQSIQDIINGGGGGGEGDLTTREIKSPINQVLEPIQPPSLQAPVQPPNQPIPPAPITMIPQPGSPLPGSQGGTANVPGAALPPLSLMNIPPEMMKPLAPTTGVPSPPQFDNPYGLNYDINQFKSPLPSPIPTSPIAPTSVLPEVLNTPTGSMAQDPVQNIITQILTNPFVSPFREEMTGNYPGSYQGISPRRI